MKTTSDELLMYATIKKLEQIKAPFVFLVILLAF